MNAGTSLRLNYETLTQQDIEGALREILGNPKYKSNANKRSSLFRDQPEKPLQRAIFWCEWLMRHPNDYSEIQLTRVAELGWVAANNFDVLLIFAVVILLLLYYPVKLLTRKKQGGASLGKKKRE